MAPDRRPRRRSPEKDEEEYLLFLHGIPPTSRWQEIKDLVKEYGTVHHRSADTVGPNHDTGFIYIPGKRNAEQAFTQFCQRGWHGQSIVVTLNGPVDRAEVAAGNHASLRIHAGPVRSPGTSSWSPPRGQRIDWSHVNAAMVRYHMSPTRGSPPMTPNSTVSTTSPTSPSHSMPQTTVALSYSIPAPCAGPTMTTDRPAPIPAYNGVIMQMQESALNRSNASTRHSAPIPMVYRPAARHEVAGPSQTSRNGNPQNPSKPRPVRVTNLEPTFSESRALALFRNFGTIETCSVRARRNSRGRVESINAFATFRSHEAAARAIHVLDGRRSGSRILCANYDDDAHRNAADPVREPGTGTGRLRAVTTQASGGGSSRHREKRRDSSEDERERRQNTRGPLVVDGARGTGRRRRDVTSRERGSTESDSDSDASDQEREARRRHSSTDHKAAEALTHRMRTVRVN